MQQYITRTPSSHMYVEEVLRGIAGSLSGLHTWSPSQGKEQIGQLCRTLSLLGIGRVEERAAPQRTGRRCLGLSSLSGPEAV